MVMDYGKIVDHVSKGGGDNTLDCTFIIILTIIIIRILLQ